MPSEMAKGDFFGKISIHRNLIAVVIVIIIWFVLYYKWISPYYVKSNGVEDTAVGVISGFLGFLGILWAA
jgi:hypothetical protein